jgi:hypothetical protein
MKRDTWEFPFAAGEVFAGAQVKERHHAERYEKYLADFKAADNDWRQGEESFKSTVGFDASYSNQPLQNRVQELRLKVHYHDTQRKDYAMWQRVIAKSAEGTLSLNRDDVIYFGLVDGARYAEE